MRLREEKFTVFYALFAQTCVSVRTFHIRNYSTDFVEIYLCTQ